MLDNQMPLNVVDRSLLVSPLSDAIVSFRGEYSFLSNFHTPCRVIYEGLEFRHSEGAFMSAKDLRPEIRKHIQAIEKPAAAKKAGGKDGIVQLRPDWEQIKYQVMLDVVRSKFTLNEDLRQKLLATEDRELIEGNLYHDTCWGNCTCSEHKGAGLNALGSTLMTVRRELRG